MKIRFLFCSPVLLLGLLAGCSTTTGGKFESRLPDGGTNNLVTATLTNQLAPELLRPGTGLFTLGPGDRLEIETLGNPASRALTVVGPDGKIYYSLLPGLDVWGMTLPQTRDLLEKELGKYLTGPHVAITLREVGSKYVWLLGRVNRPGVYPIAAPMTLLEALAMAGGTARSASQIDSDDLADLRHSFVVRQGQLLPVDFHRLLREGDASQNIVLQPDDFVYVRSALSEEVYVLGAVKLPRAIPYNEHMTLVSAIAGAVGPARYDIFATYDPGPLTKDAYLSHVAVVRGSLAQPTIAVVDYNAIIKGKAPNIRLEPGDIVYVPNMPYTTLKRYFNMILNTFVTTVAANEGIRAGGGTVGVGVSVPVGGSSAPTTSK
jgi:polysaccharide biosynthesis/export protein